LGATAELLVQMHDLVGESPLWSPADQVLWWVDIEGRRLHAFDWNSREVYTWTTPERFGCIALLGDGALLAAGESAIFRVAPRAGEELLAVVLAGAAHRHEGMRFNDGRCDRAGQFYAGTMVCDMSQAIAAGGLYRYDEHGLSAPLVDGLITPNGLAFSPDNRLMYLSDSHPDVQKIWVFNRADDGTLIKRREFVDMTRLPGRPDGAAVDADGYYWICAIDAGRVFRFSPDGRMDRAVEIPVRKPAMCAFAGPDLDWLVVTTIRPTAPNGDDPSLAGAVFLTRPGVCGLPETPHRPWLT